MFSENNSGKMCLTLEAFTLFTRPLMDFFSASQVMRWYSAPVLSACSAIICANLNGGTYAPPALPAASGFRVSG